MGRLNLEVQGSCNLLASGSRGFDSLPAHFSPERDGEAISECSDRLHACHAGNMGASPIAVVMIASSNSRTP